MRVHHAAGELARGPDGEPVGMLVGVGAHRAQAADQRRDAIALLHPQLAGAAHRDAAAERRQRGEHGQLVDDLGHFLGQDLDGLQLAVADPNRPTGSPLSRCSDLRVDDGAEAAEQVEDGRRGWD